MQRLNHTKQTLQHPYKKPYLRAFYHLSIARESDPTLPMSETVGKDVLQGLLPLRTWNRGCRWNCCFEASVHRSLLYRGRTVLWEFKGDFPLHSLKYRVQS